MAQPGTRLLERLLGEVARRRRAGRRRFLYGLAASVVLAVAGSGLMAFTGHDAAAAHVTAATDPRTGVWAEVTADDGDTGSRLLLRVQDHTGPHTCRLVVVGRDGSEQIAGTWTQTGRDTGTVTAQGASPLHPDQIARYDVRTADGQRLVSVQAP